MQTVGALIVVVVVLQLAVLILGSLRQLWGSQRQREQTFALLQARIAAANALRVQREQARRHWNGYRKFVVERKVVEAENICSFYLVPHDQKSLPQFKPGQYLTFKCDIQGRDRPVVRCYSLSERPNFRCYRVSIKRAGSPKENANAPAGLVSNYFHDHVEEGQILDVRAPSGDFTLDIEEPSPVVLIAGGIGVTPMLSMLGAIADTNSGREVWLFYGVRNRREHAMKEYLEKLAETHENIHTCICYSSPTDEDVLGRDYDCGERISAELLKRNLNSNNYDFYICGPAPMISGLISDLSSWGVPKGHIHTESFGAATTKQLSRPQIAAKPSPKLAKKIDAGDASKITVSFHRSRKVLPWSDRHECLLDFALENEIKIDFGCRAGSCHECLVAIESGEVNCAHETEGGTCLTCCSVPLGNLVLDA